MTNFDNFAAITARALREGGSLPRIVGHLFQLVENAADHENAASRDICTPRQRGYISHLAGLSTPDRKVEKALWFREAERIGLTKRHADHIIKCLRAGALASASTGVTAPHAPADTGPPVASCSCVCPFGRY